MFPERFIVRACVPNVSEYCHRENIGSSVNFCRQEANYASTTRQGEKFSIFLPNEMVTEVDLWRSEEVHYNCRDRCTTSVSDAFNHGSHITFQEPKSL